MAAGVFAVRAAIERQLLETFLTRVTAAHVSIGGVTDGLGSLSLERIHLAAGDVVLDVPRADVGFGGPLKITLHAPHAAFTPPAAALETTIAWLTAAHARLRIFDGSLDVMAASSPSATPLHLNEVAGTLALEAQANAFDLSAALVANGRAYPFHAQAETQAGVLRQLWSAAALPAALLATLRPASVVVPSAGELHDVSLTLDAAVQASAMLVDVDGTDGAHRLRGLHGPLVLRAGRLSTSGIDGFLDAAPLSYVGEIHDIRDPARALFEGTRDLGEIVRLLGIAAAQPNLRFVHLEATAPGVAFLQYRMQSKVGPRAIAVLAVDPAEPSLKFDTAIAADHIISNGERTSQLAGRTGAIAGLNGDYFDIGRSYEPQGMVIRDGAILRGPTDRAALVIDRSNKVTFAEFHLKGIVETNGRSYPITQINSWPPGDTTLITPDYGMLLPPALGTQFVRLTLVDAARRRYRVSAVEAADAGLGVSFGVAFGPLVKGVHPRVGDRFTLAYSLVPKVDHIVAGIGGGPILLRNGQWYEDPHAPAPGERDVRWPVAALGSTADGLLLLAAVDGRHPERAVGMTRPEFADLLRSYGVTDAMALDSGGSVTLVARPPGQRAASVRNKPSDDSAERFISDALLVFSSAPPDEMARPAPSVVPPATGQ